MFESIQWPGEESGDLTGGNLKPGCGVDNTGTQARRIVSLLLHKSQNWAGEPRSSIWADGLRIQNRSTALFPLHSSLSQPRLVLIVLHCSSNQYQRDHCEN